MLIWATGISISIATIKTIFFTILENEMAITVTIVGIKKIDIYRIEKNEICKHKYRNFYSVNIYQGQNFLCVTVNHV